MNNYYVWMHLIYMYMYHSILLIRELAYMYNEGGRGEGGWWLRDSTIIVLQCMM